MIDKDADHSVNAAKANTLPQKLSAVYGSEFLFENYSLHHSQKQSGFFTHLWQSTSRNLRWIFSISALAFIAAFWLSALTPAIYQATAVLEVALPYANNQSDNKATANTGLSRDYVGVYYQILNNGNLAKAVAQKLDQSAIENLASKNAYYVFNRMHQTMAQLCQRIGVTVFSGCISEPDTLSKLLSAIEVRQLHNSNLIEISVYAFDSKASADVANLAAFAALELIQQREYAANETLSAFYEKKLTVAKAQYEIADNERRNFVAANNLMTPEQRAAKLQAQQELVKLLRIKAAEAENEYTNYKRDHTKIHSPEIDALVNQKSSLDAEYQQKSSELKPMHPDMLALTEKIKALGQQITLQKSQYDNTARRRYQQLNFALNQAVEKLQKFESEDVNQQPLELENKNLNQKTELAQVFYNSLRYQYEHLKSTSGNSNLAMINQALPPVIPLKTVLRDNLLFAALLSLLGGFLLVFASMYRGRIYQLRQDVEDEYGIPVIASIPNTAGSKTAEQVFKALTSKSDEGLIAAYRKAANALYFSNEASVSRVFGVSSAKGNEGKTVTACALALEYAAAGQRVLLVDAHLRDPKLHQIFNIENQSGLTNILVSNEAPINVTHDTPFPNLYLICSGPVPANPMQLLASGKLADFLEMAKQKFDLIILDCPSINVLDEMLLIGAATDNLVICLRTAITTKISVKKAIKKMLSIKRLPTGFILTDQPGRLYAKFLFKNKVNVKNLLVNSHGSLLSK